MTASFQLWGSAGEDPNEEGKDKWGMVKPLTEAAEYGQCEAIKLLLPGHHSQTRGWTESFGAFRLPMTVSPLASDLRIP